MMEPDAPWPLDTLTLEPSSKYLIPTLQGFLQLTTKSFLENMFGNNKEAKGKENF